MFNSSAPYGEGRKDGFAGYPANRGWYDDVAWSEYRVGYADGVARRTAPTDALVPIARRTGMAAAAAAYDAGMNREVLK